MVGVHNRLVFISIAETQEQEESEESEESPRILGVYVSAITMNPNPATTTTSGRIARAPLVAPGHLTLMRSSGMHVSRASTMYVATADSAGHVGAATDHEKAVEEFT